MFNRFDEFRSWHQKKLRVTIDQMSKQPENEIKYLPTPTEARKQLHKMHFIMQQNRIFNKFVFNPSTFTGWL